MNQIHLQICGNSWKNHDEVIEKLSKIQSSWVIFDTGAEGVSLKFTGILDVINHWVAQTQRDPATVFINNPNTYEKTPYKNLYNDRHGNHFFSMSRNYQTIVPEINPQSKLFGLFLGRHTLEREQILLDVFNHWSDYFLISTMKTRYPRPWPKELDSVQSIDDVYVDDQYNGKANTNLNLLKYYDQFQIELVAETMTAGETFFPTEKTIRPISGRRPWIVFGPKHFLKNLRDMGFATYQQCWNEEYDQYDGLDRWQRMSVVIQNVIDHGYDIKTAQAIANHNLDLLKKWHK